MKNMSKMIVQWMIIVIYTFGSCQTAEGKISPYACEQLHFNNVLENNTLNYLYRKNSDYSKNVLRVQNKVNRECLIKKLKIKNPSVIGYSLIKDKKLNYQLLTIHPRRPGTTTMSFHVKDHKKHYKFCVKVNVVKYSNPFRVIRVGKKEFTSLYDSDHLSNWDSEFCSQWYHTKRNLSGVLSVQMNPGWELLQMYLPMTNNNEDWGEDNIVNNGDYLDLDYSLCPNLVLKIQHRKTKAKFLFFLDYGQYDDHNQ